MSCLKRNYIFTGEQMITFFKTMFFLQSLYWFVVTIFNIFTFSEDWFSRACMFTFCFAIYGIITTLDEVAARGK